MFVALTLLMLSIYSAERGNYWFAAVCLVSIVPGFFFKAR